MKRVATMSAALAAAVAATWLAAAPCGAQVTEPDPEAYYSRVMANGRLRTSGTGEQFCWCAAYAANDFLDAYEAFGNPKWLEMAAKYYDGYLAKLQKDPDGYEGWIGDPVGTQGQELSTDAVVGDAILCEPLTRFAWIVLKQDPKLKARFGETAQRYVDLATRICWEKWNRRQCYYQDEAGWGSYHTYGKLVDLKANKWVDAPSRVISNNLNKHYSVSLVLLRLWRITGEEKYKKRVKSVFGRAKTMWRYFADEDRVAWNFWMPHGPYDLEGRAPKSWVAVHPGRAGYQAGEVADWVEVYDSGLVFDKADLERIIRTNHWMNEGGTWRNADGTSGAGTLWSALARFDEATRSKVEAELGGKSDATSQIRLAYLKNVTEKHLGWTRRYAADESKAEVTAVPPQPGRNISMSVVIPNAVETAADGRVQLACQTRVAGTLKIELLDTVGRRVLGKLAEMAVGARGEFNAPFWDGAHPKTGKKTLGKYVVRWTLGDESRTAPVYVKRGMRQKQTGPAAMKRGETLAVDFEGALDARWSLDGAAASDAQAHGGTKSLRVDREARLTFGRQDDLPVRVTMWVYDGGATFGKKSANGPAWGVATAMGDKFCLRQVWRTYLAGDRDYSWINTGETQWFSPHPSGVLRKTGWAEWVFDFSDPAAVSIAGSGKAVGRLVPKFTPKGCVMVYLLGSRQAGPLYVDDIKVEYPGR